MNRRPGRRTRLRAVLPAVLLIAAAGCGSTVQYAATVPGGTGSGLTVGGVGPSAVASAPVAGSGSTGTSGGVASGTGIAGRAAVSGGAAAVGAGNGGSQSVGGGTTTSTSGSNGPGITASSINVGASYDPDASTADQALGAANINQGDTKTQTAAVVNYINSHGGVDHRKINLVWAQMSAYQDVSTSEQQACATWTQDNKVFVLPSGASVWDRCVAAEHAVGLTSGAIEAEDTATNQQFPADINLNGLSTDHAMQLTIEGLSREGYFSAGAKVGIATWDDPTYAWSVTHAAAPALAQLGLQNVPVAYVTSPQSYGDLGATSASASSAILKFRQLGIDHVLLFDGASGVTSSGVLTIEWMQQAQSQHYNPRYGLNSSNGLSALASDLPAQQMAGSLGIGWEPTLDLTTQDFDALPQSPNAKLCLQIMTSVGQAPQNGNEAGLELSECDGLFFLQQVLDRVSGPLNQQTALAAINAVGSGYPTIQTFGIFLSASHHDGVRLVRNVAFNGSCTCYRYTSAPYHPGG